MSPKNRSLVVGLTAPGLLGLAALRLAGAGEAPGPASAPAATEAPSSPETVLLLSNGEILRGPLVEAPDGYRILQRGGEIHFPKRSVVRTFRTIREVYDYKFSRMAQQDPVEHMKLARWCLSQDLKAEARERLEGVIELDPSNRQAVAMLSFLQNQEERQLAQAAPVDPEVARTNAMAVAPRESADALDMALMARVEEAQRKMGLGGLPQILDLPPAQAVKRYDEFYRYVHPVLQQACARCHNEQSAGNFRMVQVRLKRDWSNHTVVRANLDAALRLVDPGNLSQSPLLANALLPHGTTQQPVLRGPNDPSYRVLTTWVQRLAEARVGQPTPGMPSPAAEGFAADRQPGLAAAPAAGAFPASPHGPYATVGAPVGMPPAALPTAPPVATGDPNFPVSPLVTGQPMMPADPGYPAVPVPNLPGPGAVPPPDQLPPLPGVTPTPAPAVPDFDSPPPSAEQKPARKAKIDPAMLERMLKARNGGNP